MVASYLLSSMFVPVMTTWVLGKATGASHEAAQAGFFEKVRERYDSVVRSAVRIRRRVVPAYFAAAVLIVLLVGTYLGLEIFPTVDTGQFQIRMRAPDGTRFERTEELAQQLLGVIKAEVGAENVASTLGYVGAIPTSYAIDTIYLWMSGPHEGMIRVALKRGSGIHLEAMKERLRRRLAAEMPNVKFSFEAGDIISEVMSFGSPTPVEIAVSGLDLNTSRAYADRLRERLARIPTLRDLQYAQPLDYPTLNVEVDRELAGIAHVTAGDVSGSLVAATSSSRFVLPNFWADPKNGIGYQVQVEIPQKLVDSVEAVRNVPVRKDPTSQLLVRDVATVVPTTVPGEYDRYNMQRLVSLTANICGEDLGRISKRVARAIKDVGEPPRGVSVHVRGQIPPMRQMLRGLAIGLCVTVVVILLLLSAYFQSVRLALIVMSTVPAVLSGVVLALLVTGTTLNVQSFMGTIMAVGVAVANAIMLTTFSERDRKAGAPAAEAGVSGAHSRLRPVLMTSVAMISGMLPNALGLGESGEQIAPLGRAVIGGLFVATFTTLLILPCIFAMVQGRASTRSASLDPDDAGSACYEAHTGKGA
jgi:multidrug efflux pump subunit AcrB